MKQPLLLITMLISISLSACVATNNSANGNGGGNSERVCQKEKSTGSHIGKTVCRTKEQIEREERESKQELRRIQQKATIRS